MFILHVFNVIKWQHVSASITRPSSGHKKLKFEEATHCNSLLYFNISYIEHNGGDSPKVHVRAFETRKKGAIWETMYTVNNNINKTGNVRIT
jgi:hypothetical protein